MGRISAMDLPDRDPRNLPVLDAEVVSVEEDQLPTRRSTGVAGIDERDELLAEVHQALVDEINRQMLTQYGNESGLRLAQDIYRQLDMWELAEKALDSFQDRVALEIAKGMTRLKERADPDSVRFGSRFE